jgi:hypothetical protein
MAWLAQELTKDENIIPYCSLFTASSPFSFPANFSVSQYLGLLFCNILKDNQDIQIFACWRSEHHFGLSKDRFKRDLGLTTNLFGTIADVQRPKVSLWKGITVQVLAIAGLIGTFSVFRDYFFVLFGSPDVAISYTENKKSEDVVEGGTISIPISALSEVRFFPMKVTFESVSLKPKNGGAEQNLRFDTPMFSNLPPGQSASIKIMGLAPQHSKSQQAPDSYEIRLVATAQGGYLRANRSVLAPPVRYEYGQQGSRFHNYVWQDLLAPCVFLKGRFILPTRTLRVQKSKSSIRERRRKLQRFITMLVPLQTLLMQVQTRIVS